MKKEPEGELVAYRGPFDDETDRVRKVLEFTFGGMHHVTGKLRRINKHVFTVTQWGPLSTYDHDALTRLVVAAHDFCVRVEVQNGGPNSLKLWLCPRTIRDGSIMESHPTIENHLKEISDSARVWPRLDAWTPPAVTP